MLLQDVRIVEDGRWRLKHKGTLEGIGLMPEILSVYDREWWGLTPFTIQLIGRICDVLGTETNGVMASKLALPPRSDTIERLANILEETQATEFLTAAGSSSYLNQGDLSVPIRFHQYQPAAYEQGREFVPFMSVVDCLARHGPEETLETIRAGRVVHPIPLEETA